MMTAAASSGGLTAFALCKLRGKTPAPSSEPHPRLPQLAQRGGPRRATSDAQRRAEADRALFELARRAVAAEPAAELRRAQWG